jgi:hypothetical protein
MSLPAGMMQTHQETAYFETELTCFSILQAAKKIFCNFEVCVLDQLNFT